MPERSLPFLRAAFLIAVGVFTWIGLRGRFGDVADAWSETSPLGVAGALVLVLAGLAATGLLWLRLMAAVGAPLPWRDGLATFFVGQLGKYIPGSVWSIGAQAQMAGRRSVPARATVAAGLLFLGYHVATAAALGSLVLLLGGLDSPWPRWVWLVALLVSTLGLVPLVVGQVAQRIARRHVVIGAVDTALALLLMGVAWSAYSLALVLLSPGLPWSDVAALGGAFAVAYAAGVVVVLAPAGLGAREGVFVLLLAPVTGVAEATALALLARVVHGGADGLMALGAWGLAASSRNRKGWSVASSPYSEV